MFNLFLRLAIYILLFAPRVCMAEEESWRNRPSSNIEFTAGDIAAEISFGREIAARIFGMHPAYDNPELTRYVTLVGKSLALSTNRPELEFHFVILDTDELNSYATPGGYVFITRGSLKMMEDESELAGVLAYQIAHIVDKHIVSELKIKGRDDPSSLALLISGSAAALRSALQVDKPVTSIRHSDITIDKGFELIYRNTYRTVDNVQAGKTSLILSALCGYDPEGHVRYLDRIKQSLASTPETPDEFIVELNTKISQIQQALAEEDFGNLSYAINLTRFTETMKNLK